ncbi:MAG: IPExxxVDY family protein [Bacteroidetes bacterium]|nr:IPExxxVDY family protein [Bacteroidota bacterium]
MKEKKIGNEISFDFKLVGIATTLKEYRLCFYLNQIFGCDFAKLKDHCFESKDRTRKHVFSVLKGEDENLQSCFFVFSNKNYGEYLVDEASEFDYILSVKGAAEDAEIAAWCDQVKILPDVLLCRPLLLKKNNSKERLIYQEEKSVQRLAKPKRMIS